MDWIKTGPLAIYARFSSDRQNERSIDDQVRRCQEFIAQRGGDPAKARVFADYAESGGGMDRSEFETMTALVEAGRIKGIVTEDMSRISRDFVDSAQIFRQLQFRRVPLVGVADGIDTSARGAKLSFTVRSLFADMYLDDLRDKTLRGLEGRALDGFATGNVAYGFHTVPAGEPSVSGNRIAIHEAEAPIVRRIFTESRDGRSLTTIAHGLNRDGIPSPRVGSKHKCFGWGASTIRAILYNERYIGVWRFKERQWVKIPGTNRRQPRPRDAAEIMVKERPDLRIIDQKLWDEVQARLALLKQKYAGGRQKGGLTFKRAPYLLSGILVCAACGAPMSMNGGSHARYYRCQTNKTKGTCSNRTNIREDNARTKILAAVRDRLLSPNGIAHTRKRVAEELRDYSQKIAAELRDRRERLARTEDKMRGLVDFIATGERSEYVVSTLRDLEAFTRQERAALSELEQASREPLRLPSIDEVCAKVADLDARLAQDPEAGREQLRRWLKDGSIRVGPDKDGAIVAEGDILPLVVISDGGDRKKNYAKSGLVISRSSTDVAGAGFEPATFGL